MKTFGSIVLMVVSVLQLLAVIAAMQYGYHHGPNWLFRFENGAAAMFPVVSGFASILASAAGVGFSVYCMTEGPKK